MKRPLARSSWTPATSSTAPSIKLSISKFSAKGAREERDIGCNRLERFFRFSDVHQQLEIAISFANSRFSSFSTPAFFHHLYFHSGATRAAAAAALLLG